MSKLKNGILKIIKVRKLAIMPWSTLPKIYGLIESFDLLIILRVCSSTDIPPNPRIKADTHTLIDKFFKWTEDIILKPLVNSIIPEINPTTIFEFICNNLEIGDAIITSNFVLPKIERITEKRVTKPPITRIVFILLIILFPRTSPKLLMLTLII